MCELVVTILLLMLLNRTLILSGGRGAISVESFLDVQAAV